MSVDGFVAGPHGEMDWTNRNWDNALKNYVGAITQPVDCILLGRKLAEGFIPYWASHPEEAGAEKFNQTHKVVFSQTLANSEWENTVLAKGNLVDEIMQLKQQAGADLIAYGGATFVSALIQHSLIDEYHLFINPTALGQGKAIFAGLNEPQNLNLKKSTAFECGIVVLNYELKCD